MFLPSGVHNGALLMPGNEVRRDVVSRSTSFTQMSDLRGPVSTENAKRLPSGENRGDR